MDEIFHVSSDWQNIATIIVTQLKSRIRDTCQNLYWGNVAWYIRYTSGQSVHLFITLSTMICKYQYLFALSKESPFYNYILQYMLSITNSNQIKHKKIMLSIIPLLTWNSNEYKIILTTYTKISDTTHYYCKIYLHFYSYTLTRYLVST